MLYRHYQNLQSHFKSNKVNIIYGPRQVGKTTLLKHYTKSLQNKRFLFKTGDELDVAELFEQLSIEQFRTWVSDIELLIIDEAQLIPQIGRGLKLLHDHFEQLEIVVTGSASFDLVNKIGEPLTGRDHVLTLFPIAQLELLQNTPKHTLHQQLKQYLIYGSYPEVINLPLKIDKQNYLEKMINSYLLKDVLALEQIKGSKKILDLLRLIAFQIGKEVSTVELGSQLDLDKKTIIRYLDLLEKAFVLINIRGFSRNLRKEVSKSSRYYFWDNGIRNSLIRNFNEINLRNDIGQLWENFLVIERIKKQYYFNQKANNYFWRTYDQKELDWVEEKNDQLRTYEFKWGTKQPKPPHDFLQSYENSTFKVINRDNYFKFIS